MSRSARYSLNFRAHKICLNKLPDFMKPRVKTLNVHLDAINCDPFFYWDKKNNPAEISLDNPKMPKILPKTDYRPVHYRSQRRKIMSDSKTVVGSKYAPKYVGDYFKKP